MIAFAARGRGGVSPHSFLFSESVCQERGGGGAWNRQRSWRGSAASQKLGAAPGGDKQVSHSVSSRQRHLSLHENLSRALPGLPACERAPVPAPWRRQWLRAMAGPMLLTLGQCPSPVPWSFSRVLWSWQEAPAPLPPCPGTHGTSDAAPELSRDSPGCLRDPGVFLT